MCGDDGPGHQELALQVDGDAEVPLALAHVLERGEVLVLAIDDHAGVVDEDVDAAVRGDRLVDDPLHVGGLVRSAVWLVQRAPRCAGQACTASAMSTTASPATSSSAKTWAVAKPMPSCLATPVTRATLPASRPLRSMSGAPFVSLAVRACL